MEEGCGWKRERILEMENGASVSPPGGGEEMDAGCQGMGGVLEAKNRHLI